MFSLNFNKKVTDYYEIMVNRNDFQADSFVFDLRFNISMENTISMHVINSLKYLVHVVLDSLFRQVVTTSFDSFIHVHVH